MDQTLLPRLHAAVSAVCPILGVSIDDPEDKASWRIDFTDEATAPERAAGQAALDGLDIGPTAALEQRKAALTARVNEVRDARINGGFEHDGHTFQSAPSDRENIVGLAFAASGSPMTPGDLRWFNPDADFKFITADNQLVAMDAPAVVALYARGMGFKAAVTYFARAYKDAILAAADHGVLDVMEAGIESGEVGPFTGWPA